MSDDPATRSHRPWRLTPRRGAGVDAESADLRAMDEDDPISAQDARQIADWLSHPDEATALAAAELLTTRVSLGADSYARQVARAAEVAIEHAAAEGLYWTPRLDTLAQPDLAWASNVLNSEPARRLQDWAGTVTSAEHLGELMRRTASPYLRYDLAFTAAATDDALLRGLPLDRPLIESWIATPTLADHDLVPLFRQLGEERRLFELARLDVEIELSAARQHAAVDVIEQHFYIQPSAAGALPAFRDPAAFARAFEVFLEGSRTPERTAVALARHPALTTEQALRLWEARPLARVGMTLARRGTLGRDAKVRAALKASTSVQVGDAWFESATSIEEILEALPDYLERRPARALAYLLDPTTPERARSAVSREMLLGVLKGTDENARRMAFALMKKVAERPDDA